ncbi:phenylalanine--tRNA ligase subunit beta [Legionella hackeliae]|uniref:Phenylalanine--tRNA ligase beta subunit n=1 Tax=Legionella hackeliae TaxID=449 RepID=A0A0A8USN5_LEGHA|nr:phenylalanine--tRNA ligase subunit beta [Legionella hackeliae]KTD09956.1 phenylalanyl-tRNA synthetase subunit beta [Legionella hackeliae]CEK11743.1 Phenylalanyl-tRNA synthetase beta chain [Legionella hackeliae]STX48513.1 Phenylalanyl-tRNA synthetase beta subunit [Legionella hackeliae]
MKVSELWLREWVNPSLDEQQLAALLTMAGLEVDAVNPVAGKFNNVIVGQVTSTKPHPQADKLTLCEVNTGTGQPLKVVCGASNVRPGLKVALAQIGAHLPGDLTIKESMLKGELSQGMLCSTTELGLTEQSDGIMELDDNAPVGMDIRTYLNLNDWVFDIDLTPNRADCFSVLGVAREVAAITQTPLKTMPNEVVQPASDEQRSIKLQAPEACPQYYGRVIRDINPEAITPVWMIERLRRAGVRPIHPVVDVTNYVMLELGQPMHAFDLNALQGDIIVRMAKAKETLTLLDGQEVDLHERVLVIADNQQPLAMAGVMGGEHSAVQEQTTAVFLESAFFSPLTIAGVARSYGLCTDSSQRFERGVDPQLQSIALERATALLLDIVGGIAGPVCSASKSEALPAQNTVLFNPSRVTQVTGLTIDDATMIGMLERLGMQIDKSTTPWKVKIPSHRFDISLDVDLVEEIARLNGYDQLPGSKMIAAVQAGRINPTELLGARVAQLFISRGYHETISYSFVDPELQEALYPQQAAMQLLNPISSELSQMRVGMWPGLLASMIYNIHRQQTAIKFFESGVIFELKDGELHEHPCIAGLLTGEYGTLNWGEKSGKFDFYDLKGDLEALFALLQIEDVSFTAAQHAALHPGKSAKIIIANQETGWCGVLHPRIADALDIHDDVVMFELRLNPLISETTSRYQQISKFPQIRRDLSLLVDNEITAAQIEGAVREVVEANYLKSFDVFDVYMGESIPEGKKSLAIALTLQDDKRTMVDTEINTIISAILKALNEKFAIILRD